MIRAYGVARPGRAGAALDLHRRRGGHRPLPPRRAPRASTTRTSSDLHARCSAAQPRRRPDAGAAMAGGEPPRSRSTAAAGDSRGEAIGEGPPIVLCHGITATRRYVVHGSRGAGARRPPADLLRRPRPRRVRPRPGGRGLWIPASWSPTSTRSSTREVGEGRFVLAGHSMGAHTAVAYALAHPERLAGLVVIGPVYMGVDRRRSRSPTGTGSPTALERGRGRRLRRRTSTATRHRPGLARLGPALHPRADARCTATPRRSPRRCARCRARARSSRWRSSSCSTVPALVVASHDDADPGHPYAVAEAYAERLPAARADQRGGGRVAARLAGRQALARDRRLLRRAGRGRAPRSARRRAGRRSSPVSFADMIDDGHAIHYAAVERGTPVYSSDGVEVGKVGRDPRQLPRAHLRRRRLQAPATELRFADAPEVARTAERGVTLTITAEEARLAAAARPGRRDLPPEPARRAPRAAVRARLEAPVAGVPRPQRTRGAELRRVADQDPLAGLAALEQLALSRGFAAPG